MRHLHAYQVMAYITVTIQTGHAVAFYEERKKKIWWDVQHSWGETWMIYLHTTPIKMVVCILGCGCKLHHLSLRISIPASLLVSNDQVIRWRWNDGGIDTNRALATITHTNTCSSPDSATETILMG